MAFALEELSNRFGISILLAGGQLSPLALSDAERARIDGEPGAGSADLIRVELGEGATLPTPGGAFFGLPQLIGNEGDVLDGVGAVLQPAGPLPTGEIGMFTVSSEIEVPRFSFDGYPFGVIVAGAPGSADLEEIRVSENTFSDYETGVVIAPNSNGSKGLRGLSIDGNRFMAGAGSINAIVVLGASPRVPGEVAADYVVEDVVIRKNEIRGGFGGIAKFKVIEGEGKFELRQYASHIVAEPFVEGDFGEVGNEAFRRLAGYINGQNRRKQTFPMTAPVSQEADSVKIPMTAPVNQEKAGENWRFTFLMPAEYTLETLSEPLDSRAWN